MMKGMMIARAIRANAPKRCALFVSRAQIPRFSRDLEGLSKRVSDDATTLSSLATTLSSIVLMMIDRSGDSIVILAMNNQRLISIDLYGAARATRVVPF